jgi:hypothetical protein
MTEKRALILDVVVGYVVTMGSVVLLDHLGVNGTVVVLVGMAGLVVTCLLIGAIDVYYVRKAIERGEDPDEL